MQKRKSPVLLAGSADMSRRRFLQGVAAGGALMGVGGFERPVWALSAPTPRQELSGTRFELSIGETPVNFTGKIGVATAVNGQLPAPLLRWREGDTVTLKVTNRLKEPTSIHWHGIILPNAMDGVPGLTFDGIAPGESFTYQFPVRQSGTYWYHSHSGYQEQTGLYGPIIIEPRTPAPYHFDREYVVMFSDWTDDTPGHVYSRLKKMDGYYNYAQPTLGDFIDAVRKEGWSKAFGERAMWDRMRMSPHDIADVSGATYTYLLNGTTPAGNWTALFKPGEKVLLRFINGGAMTYFDVRIPGLKMTVVAADGQYVHPVSVDEFRIGCAEVYDVIVEPEDDRAYTIFAQSMDRSGYARATLAPRQGMSAPVPALDPVPTLTMADMGMAMDGMAMSGGSDMGNMDMNGGSATGSPSDSDMSGMDMDGMAMPSSADKGGMVMQGGNQPDEGMSETAMSSMDHSAHGAAAHHSMNDTAMSSPTDMGGMAMQGGNQPEAMNEITMSSMDHSAHGAAAHHSMSDMGSAMDTPAHHHDPSGMAASSRSNNGIMNVAHHPATENGPGSSIQASVVSTRLDDPGAGLRNNGRRVLTYADLRGMDGWLDNREPSRTIEFHLTGNMARYMWSFDGVSYADAEPVHFKRGEVVRIVLVNDTMMEHPIHLHGMWSELEDSEGNFQVRKHTVSVKPGHAVTYRVLADAEGRWAYHCHLFFHMMGMFREVRVS